jgi:phosphoserine phosphatase RsbU/P
MQTLERRCQLLLDNERRPEDWVAAQDNDQAARPTSARAGVLPHFEEKLRGVQSITDRALSELDSQALLEALVERVREALQADTSAVLLLDHPSGQLVATAASGLEEEVQQGVRIHIGQGFAGRIAAQGTPVILDEVDHTKVVNPILLSKGIRSLMGAPLIANGAVIGVLHVGTLKPRRFTTDDVDLLQLAADRAAMAVQALQGQLDRAAASALQRSLLPSDLPSVPGLSMATRYVPGTGNVGGDWYDVFPLPSGELCAVIGDVAGSGLRAAAIMGRVRSALRAYALESSDPAEILSRLEKKLRYFEPDVMVTLLCAVFSRSGDQVRMASAGHLPPILARPGQAAVPADIVSDLLIGVPEVTARHITAVDFPAGATLCLYTDGLIERRGQAIDDGIRKLCAAVPTGDPEVACACVMAAMADGMRTDDVALLIISREPGQVPGSAAGPGGAA